MQAINYCLPSPNRHQIAYWWSCPAWHRNCYECDLISQEQCLMAGDFHKTSQMFAGNFMELSILSLYESFFLKRMRSGKDLSILWPLFSLSLGPHLEQIKVGIPIWTNEQHPLLHDTVPMTICSFPECCCPCRKYQVLRPNPGEPFKGLDRNHDRYSTSLFLDWI